MTRRGEIDFRSMDLDIIAVVLVTFACCAITLIWIGVPPFRVGSYVANAANYIAAWVFLFVGHSGVSLIRAKPDRPIAFIVTNELSAEYRARVLRAIPMILTLIIFMPMFSAMKSSIPLFNEFSWDSTWIEMDRMIHGTDPWKLTQNIFGLPILTFLVACAYHFWILLIYIGGIYFLLYCDDGDLRRRYFVTYFASWVFIGIFLAAIFSSVGPCFVGPIMGIDTFSEQMAYLNRANEEYPVLVIDVQQQLLNWHFAGSHGLGRGITAMPSMHVGLALLFALAMAKISRLWGTVFWIFFVVILLGSVHLGYHYAVDGYVSAIVTIIIWKLAGLWVGRQGDDSHTGALPTQSQA